MHIARLLWQKSLSHTQFLNTQKHVFGLFQWQIALHGISPVDIYGEGEFRMEKLKQTTSELFADL